VKIDLHVHTKPKSPCSNMTPEGAIAEAKKIGIDGICFTEHDVLWSDEEIEQLRKDEDFLILRGCEISSMDGHFLIFGLEQQMEPFLTIQEIAELRKKPTSFLAIAHPFREFLVVGLDQLNLNIEEESRKDYFVYLDGIEIKNGRSSKKANRFAERIANKLELRGIGGSDAHEYHEIGKVITEFQSEITNETDLIKELKNGTFKVEYFRD